MKPKQKFSLGLDIGTQAIKAIRLGFIKDEIELCGFKLETDIKELPEALKRIKESLRHDAINISISGPSTLIRYVNFPKMSLLELKQALRFEAQKHIPFSLDEINLDACILKEDLPDNKMLVLLAAVKKDFLSQRLKLIEESGLRVRIVDLDPLALVNCFNFNYPKDGGVAEHKVLALLNIGAATSSLNILETGIPRLSRDIYTAGNNFTQRLMDAFSLDIKSAEELKLKSAMPIADLLPQAGMPQEASPEAEKIKNSLAALEPLFTNLASAVRTSFDYYESQSASTVAKILLSGGSCRLMGLKETLTNLLNIEVDYWDPLRQLVISQELDAQKLKGLSCQLAVALGLALRQ